MKIGYQGVEGSFSEMALRQYFGSGEYAEQGYRDFLTMFQDLEKGLLDYALFPVENTTTGIIARTYDYFQYYKVYAIGEIVLPIHHSLISKPGTKIEEISEVYSHPEALSQCQGLFSRYPQLKPVVYEDTALSVRYVKESPGSHKAALAGELAAQLNEMQILLRDVQDNDANMTRFLVVCNQEAYADDADKISIRIVLKHVPGALYHALGIFASKDINVLKLESRPIAGKVFEYCFYLDFAGNIHDPDVQEVLRRLEYDCLDLKVFGNYKAAE